MSTAKKSKKPDSAARKSAKSGEARSQAASAPAKPRVAAKSAAKGPAKTGVSKAGGAKSAAAKLAAAKSSSARSSSAKSSSTKSAASKTAAGKSTAGKAAKASANKTAGKSVAAKPVTAKSSSSKSSSSKASKPVAVKASASKAAVAKAAAKTMTKSKAAAKMAAQPAAKAAISKSKAAAPKAAVRAAAKTTAKASAKRMSSPAVAEAAAPEPKTASAKTGVAKAAPAKILAKASDVPSNKGKQSQNDKRQDDVSAVRTGLRTSAVGAAQAATAAPRGPLTPGSGAAQVALQMQPRTTSETTPVTDDQKKTGGRDAQSAPALSQPMAHNRQHMRPGSPYRHIPPRPTNGVKLGFKPNEFIVYPAHGVGQITAVEVQEVAGFQLELFVISFIKDKMILKVPTPKVASVGMRKLADGPIITKALETLTGRARIKRTMWSRRAQEYEAKINSGDLIAIAEVVRDLYRSDAQPEQSYSERQLYEAAVDRMSRELAVVNKITDQESLKLIETQLQKGPRRGVKADAEAEAETEAEGDIEEAA